MTTRKRLDWWLRKDLVTTGKTVDCAERQQHRVSWASLPTKDISLFRCLEKGSSKQASERSINKYPQGIPRVGENEILNWTEKNNDNSKPPTDFGNYVLLRKNVQESAWTENTSGQDEMWWRKWERTTHWCYT